MTATVLLPPAPHRLDPALRLRSSRLLAEAVDGDARLAREVEAAIHSVSCDRSTYVDHVKRCVVNMRYCAANRTPDAVLATDDELLRGTELQRRRDEEARRSDVFRRMLDEKASKIADGAASSSLRCKRCGSADVQWVQKQTRGADEAMTVFCSCGGCGNKWVLR